MINEPLGEWEMEESERQEMLKRRNEKARKLLEEWTATPDDKGDEWWDDFEREIRINRASVYTFDPADLTDEEYDAIWERLFADPRSEAVLQRLANEADAEYAAGLTEPLDPDTL